MLKKIFFLLSLLLLLCSCHTKIKSKTPTANNAVGEPWPLGYDFIAFDSDGDGTKDDIAELTCLGMSGGYGSFRLEVYVSGMNGYTKIFDSERYVMDELTYQRLCEDVDEELMIDTFYSVEAADMNGDGRDELVCRQYAWYESHSNHIGDVVSVLEVSDIGVEIVNVRFESQK